MNTYLVLTPQCVYFINASDLASAALQASIWNSCRVVKWMLHK